ncbi:hypothetical protein M413DRAFT_345145 [Hebeloma cylindrosporum]|uniref:Uncharacterized protein n=1 Tax=Hebeloma cylindrosporum TaxID=76867 RepID=A0A0C3CPF5_HEBCY|nr:hypothetical protein M413DRAFT_345145 [Hebeloma cylindrosporum h7]
MTTVAGINDDSLVAEIASLAYTPALYSFHDLPFCDLPQTAQEFLTHTTNLYPDSPEIEGLEYFEEISHIRKSRAARLQRVLEGVNRGIADNMILLANPTHDDGDDTRNIAIAQIQNILLPEWRSHLDDHVEEIDALAWFEIHTRKGTPYPFSLERVLRDREEYVALTVEFALQSLQLAYEKQLADEKLKREARGSARMAAIANSMGDDLGSIAWQDSASESGWVDVGA